MIKKVIKDYMIMDNGNEITLVCESHLLTDVNIENLGLVIDQKSVDEKYFILTTHSKKDIIKFVDFEVPHLKQINEKEFLYLIVLKDDIIEKSFKINKIK